VQTVTIHPGAISGTVAAPPSKSVTQRVLACLLSVNGSTRIINPGFSADERVVMQVLKDAGFMLTGTDEGHLNVQSPLERQPVVYADFGESGLAARMLTPILAMQNDIVRLEASKRLRARPMGFLDDVLPKLGVRTATVNAHLPATIQGPLQPADISIDASDSSQPLTGLLIAFSALNASDKTITVSNLVSKPYIDVTLSVMGSLGLPLPENRDYESFYFPPKHASKKVPDTISIEGDWSGAAFLLVAGAIAGSITVAGLDAFTMQADKQVLSALMDCEVPLSIESTQVKVAQASRFKAFHFNATDCPDLFPPLAALACYAQGTSVIEGVDRLRFKESNRALTITQELRKLGADIELQDDYMIIRGGQPLRGTDLYAHEDHRIAMMCAVAALGADGIVTINGAEAVEKSYPRFFDDLRSLGAQVIGLG
jgi:3-phosphoshikimate 1-carboxyvinyltransferase